MHRRSFLIAGASAGLLRAEIPDSFPSQSPALAREMVGVSHSNLARVKELIKLRPALAKASYDWGFGDWETALGAASHVGNREIAEVLLEAGAGPTIFSAAMLGQADVVKAMIAAQPSLASSLGPHSIPLIAHAKGPALEYLKTVPAAAAPPPPAPLSEEQLAALPGKYENGIEITRKEKQLSFAKNGGSVRIHHLGNLAFRPAGATAVRIRFEGDVLTVEDGDIVVRSQRIAK